MKWLATGMVATMLFLAGYGLGRFTADDSANATASRVAKPPSESGASPENAQFIADVTSALSEPMLLERTMRSGELLSQLSSSNAMDVLAAYKSKRAAYPLQELLINAWVRLDGQGAFDHFTGGGEFREQQMMPGLVEGWATLEPQAALRAYRTLDQRNASARGPASRSADAVLQALSRGWARSGEPGLLEFLAEHNEGSKLSKLVKICVEGKLEREGLEETRDWADDVASNKDFAASFRRLFVDAVGGALAERDGPFAASWATKYVETPFAARAILSVASEWVRSDGVAAMRWLATLPASKTRDDGVAKAYKRWQREDEESAMAWADGVEGEDELVFEPAMRFYAEALAESDPEAALVVAGRIRDDKLRTSCLVRIGKTWYANAPGPATAWLETSGLDEEQRANVTAAEKRRRKRAARQDKKTNKPGVSGMFKR